MNIKSLTLTATLIAAHLWAAGQDLAVWAGYTIHPVGSASFEEYFQSYNLQNVNTIKTNYPDTWGSLDGLGWQFSYFSTSTGFQTRFSTGVSYLNARREAIMGNGDGRQLHLHLTDWTIDLGLGPSTKYFYFNVNIGMNMRMAKLRSAFVFSDGSISYGMDHWQNGIYTAPRLTALMGATLGISISSNIQLVCRADWVPPRLIEDMDKSAFRDHGDFKSLEQPTFPRNVVTYVSDPYNTENRAYNDFTGMRYTIAIQFNTKFDD